MKPVNTELVVVLHGLGMAPIRMIYLTHRLRKAGFDTLNLGYPSRKKTIEASAKFVGDKIKASDVQSYLKVHFVTHSLGGLVALHLLSDCSVRNACRMVLIAPPYRGSEVVEKLQHFPLFDRLIGPAGRQLTTSYRAAVSFDLPTNLEIGVLAGIRAYEYPFFLSIMKPTGAHDGVVSVHSTHVPNEAAHDTIRISHSLMIEASGTKVVHFLRHGRFNPQA